MPGLASLAGVGPLITLGPHQIQVRAKTLRHICETEAMIVSFRGDPLNLVRRAVSSIQDDALRVAVSSSLLQKVRKRFLGVSHEHMSEWLYCFEGRMFRLWQSVRHAIPSFSELLDLACHEIDTHGQVWLNKAELACDIASGNCEYSHLYEIRHIYERQPDSAPKNSQGYDSLVRSLSKEPFHFPIEAILDMTLSQVSVIVSESDGDERNSEPETRADATAIQKIVDGLHWAPKYKLMSENIAAGKHIMSGLVKGS